MQLRRLSSDEAAVRRYVEELWLQYNRDLAAVVDRQGLVDDPDADIIEAELAFRTDRLEEDDYELVVAVDPPEATDEAAGVSDVIEGGIAEADGDLAGCVSTEVEEAPDVFTGPDQLVVCDIYVRGSYRGGELARLLMDVVAERARAEGCGEVVLDVDVDNDRALAFYRKLGFEPVRHRMAVDADTL